MTRACNCPYRKKGENRVHIYIHVYIGFRRGSLLERIRHAEGLLCEFLPAAAWISRDAILGVTAAVHAILALLSPGYSEIFGENVQSEIMTDKISHLRDYKAIDPIWSIRRDRRMTCKTATEDTPLSCESSPRQEESHFGGFSRRCMASCSEIAGRIGYFSQPLSELYFAHVVRMLGSYFASDTYLEIFNFAAIADSRASFRANFCIHSCDETLVRSLHVVPALPLGPENSLSSVASSLDECVAAVKVVPPADDARNACIPTPEPARV